MKHRVRVLPPAERDVRENHAWWSENRSAEQADRWFDGIDRAIQSLRSKPQRCPLAFENDLFEHEIRQMAFGLGRRPSHRIIFTIQNDEVIVYRVRSLAQQQLGFQDLSE